MDVDFRILRNPRRFEDLCKFLLQNEYSDVKPVEGLGGDEGVDSFRGSYSSRKTIFQIKFFCDKLRSNEKRKIANSLERAAERKPSEWILLVPLEYTMWDWKWWEDLERKYPLIKLDVWLKPKLLKLIYAKKNEGLKEMFPELFPQTEFVSNVVKETLKQIRTFPTDELDRLIPRVHEEVKRTLTSENGNASLSVLKTIIEIESTLTTIASEVGADKKSKGLVEVGKELAERQVVDPGILESILAIWAVRNRLVYGADITERDLKIALYVSTSILVSLKQIHKSLTHTTAQPFSAIPEEIG